VSPALHPPARLQIVRLCVVLPEPAFCRAEFQPATKIGDPGDRGTLAEDKLAVSPAGTEVVSVTLPVKPLRLVRVRVDVVEEPCATLRVLGLALMEKSGFGEALTVTEIATE